MKTVFKVLLAKLLVQHRERYWLIAIRCHEEPGFDSDDGYILFSVIYMYFRIKI